MLDATSYAQAKSIAKREAQEVACEIPIATTSTVGTVKIGNGINVDAAGTITPDTANIDVTQLKNFSSLTTGSPKGFFDSTATLATFSSCAKGDFFIYDGAETFSLGGYTFNSGDQLWCTTATTTTPANLTNNFAYVPESTAQATATSFGTVKLGSATPLMDGTAAVGTSQACAREDHRHNADTSREPAITAGTTSQYYRGDKTFQTLNKSAVGLGNVDNTSDANKPVSTAQAAADALKLNVVDSPTVIDWGPSTTVRAGEIRRCVTSQGEFTSGQVIRSKDARTTGTVFNSTEAAYWDQAGVGAGTATPLMDGTAAVGTGAKYAREDHVHPTDTTRAPLASPALTDIPTSPTAAVNTNTTQIATTAFVIGHASAYTPLMDGTATIGTGTRFARADHVHPSDTSKASLASPAFTGTPTVPTAAAGTNTTQAASTAFVMNRTTPSYMRAENSSEQTASTVGTIVAFASVVSSSGSDITLSSNCFLLKSGNTYELSATTGYASFSGAGWVQYKWRTGQTGGSGTIIGTTGEIDAGSFSQNASGGSSFATAIYTPTSDTYVHLEIIGASMLTSVGQTSVATIKVMH
jgi:hypothetical protein